MDVNEIIDAIILVNDTLTDKGWYTYGYNSFSIDHASSMQFSIVIRPPYDSPHDADWKPEDNITIKEQCKGTADLRACMNRFTTAVMTHLSIDDYMRGRYMQKLVDLAEEGERLGFAMEYVEVLRSTAKALATNALTSNAASSTSLPD